MRPPPEKYDPDKLSHWSITMTLAWIIRRDLDAVRNEWDDYRNECADWIFKMIPTRMPAQRKSHATTERELDERMTGNCRRQLQKKFRRSSEGSPEGHPGTFTNGHSLDGAAMLEG